MVLTTSDLAKYPFLSEAAEYIRARIPDLKIEDLADPSFKPVLDRAEERIREALLNNPPEVTYRTRNTEIEIISFPVAVMIAAATGNEYIKRRYALAEARRAYTLLRLEDRDKILDVARNFNWRLKPVGEEDLQTNRSYDFKLNFIDYLRNAGNFHESEWKLVNRFMLHGEVYLTTQEAARLLQEEIRRHIEEKLRTSIHPGSLPQNVVERVERLRSLYSSRVGEPRFEELPRGMVDEALPPCIRQLYNMVRSGTHISHVGRFTLTSFLLHTGMSIDEVVNLFRSFSDFNERMTRYQVEHIAGDRGSRTKYTPPSCDTLRTHGICPGMDDLCRTVRHPLTYYRRKLRRIRATAPAGVSEG